MEVDRRHGWEPRRVAARTWCGLHEWSVRSTAAWSSSRGIGCHLERRGRPTLEIGVIRVGTIVMIVVAIVVAGCGGAEIATPVGLVG
jgi:hypothetical protein